MQSVVIYTRSEPRCSFCAQAKSLLAIEDIPFTEVDMTTAHQALKEELFETLGRPERLLVPQIFIGGKHIGGYSDLKKLYELGRLHQMVAGE